jgi:hypothetical protein
VQKELRKLQGQMNILKLTVVLLLFGAAGSSSGIAQSFLTNGLVAYYPFNGNANDESGFNRNGTISGDVSLTSDRLGIAARAYRFDGTNDWISASPSIDDVTNNFTMSVWFRPAEIHRTNEFGPCLIFPAHGAATWGDLSIGVGISAGTNQIAIWEHTHDYNPKVLSFDGDFGGWTAAVLVYTNRRPFLYVNGVLVASGNQSPRSPVRPSNGQALTPEIYGSEEGGFGGYHQVVNGLPGSFFKGDLDEIRIYNRALSSSEVAQLYAFETPELINIRKAVYIDSFTLRVGTNYQLQVSMDFQTWTNHGSVFTATNSTWRSTDYWDVDNWSQLFFRLRSVP